MRRGRRGESWSSGPGSSGRSGRRRSRGRCRGWPWSASSTSTSAAPAPSPRGMAPSRRGAWSGGWHGDREVSGGGTLMDNGPHACDLIRLLLGDVESAGGVLRHDPDGPPGCEVEAFGLFQGRGGPVGELHSSWALRRGYLTVEA